MRKLLIKLAAWIYKKFNTSYIPELDVMSKVKYLGHIYYLETFTQTTYPTNCPCMRVLEVKGINKEEFDDERA